ncbi:hypothetical protein ABPG72_006261 [Tetrahymena utriculariae]
MGQNQSSNNNNNHTNIIKNTNQNLDHIRNLNTDQNSNSQSVFIFPSFSKFPRSLCYIDKDDSGEITELKFEDKTYSEMLQSHFIQLLDQNSNKKIKIITTFGEMGQGKSFIQNFLIQSYEQNKECAMIFPFQQDFDTKTKGIDFYCIEDKEDKNGLTILFDCEGFDYSNQSTHMKNLQKLICLIVRISTCVLYVHENARRPQGFEQLLNFINADEQRENTVHNFIEIVNKWNGDDEYKSFKQIPQYNKKISQVFYLKTLQFQKRNDQEKSIYISKIGHDHSFEEFIKEINNITKYCKNSKYKTSFANCKAFELDQSCKSFKEMLLCSFQSIQEKIDVSLGLFISIINQQLAFKREFTQKLNDRMKQIKLEIKNYFETLLLNQKDNYISFLLLWLSIISFTIKREKIITDNLVEASQQWKQEFEKQLDQVITQNQTYLSDERKKIIIQQYTNLESVMPEEIKINDFLRNTGKYNQIWLIIKIIFLILFPSLISLTGIFTPFFTMIKYNNVQKNIRKKMIDYQNQGKLVKGNCSQNIQLLKQIINEENLQLNQEANETVFIIFFNVMHSSVLQFTSLFNNQLLTFEIDNLVLKSCTQKFRSDNRIQSINLNLIYEQPKIIIKDSDFQFLQTQEEILFNNEMLISNSQALLTNINQDNMNEKQIYKMLYFLKNRNEDLFLSFICQAYFYEYIYSKDLAEKLCDQQYINRLLSIQKKLI